MHAIILVGGRGTRLQPLTDTRPKPMLPIVDVPFLAHQIELLRSHGVTDITFACGFMPGQIVSHFGDGEDVGVALHYVIEPEPLGTGGAIGYAARSIGAQRVIVCNGDVLTDLDLGELVRFHERRGAVGTIALTPVEDPSRYGLVRIDEKGAVTAFLEKPSAEEIDTNLINAGTYVLEPTLIERVPVSGRSSIERDIFPQFVGAGLHAMAARGYWRDIGTVPSYVQANVDLLGGVVAGAGRCGQPHGPAELFIDESAVVSGEAVLRGPAYIGPGSRVAAGATVGPHAVVSARVVVADGARVARSVLLEGATLEPGSQVVDSVVGERAVVHARCSVSNHAVVAPGSEVDDLVVRGG